MNKIELMAPAGSLEILKAAVDYGADSVYLGVGAYNARLNATNFTIDDLYEGVSYAHLRSASVYLTLNTIVNDYEIDEAIDTAISANEAGIDGIIVQDIGLASKLHEALPSMKLIASTQMNIYSSTEVSKLKEQGFTRIVLPREMSMDEIFSITKVASSFDVETEVFVHGAVCVSCSGLCLFSAMNKSGSRSGNRGLCAQPCRQEYDLYANNTKIKSGHLLSPKDRSALEYIVEFIKAGVSCLKIEGRMRDKSYVTNAVRAYREIIDACYDGTYDKSLVAQKQNDLLSSFNRGGSFTSQYLSGKKDENFLSGEYVGKFGLRLGSISSVDARKGTITFSWNKKLPLPAKGEYLSLRTGSLELASFPVGKIHELTDALCIKGLHPEAIDKLKNVKNKISVYLMNHEVLLDKDKKRKTPVDFVLSQEGDCYVLELSVSSGINFGVSADYDVPVDTDYNGAPLDNERIIAQLSKLGDTPFFAKSIRIAPKTEFKCKVSLINELRRGAIESLSAAILNSYESNALSFAEYDDYLDVGDDWENADNKDDSNLSNTSNYEVSSLSMIYFPTVKSFTYESLSNEDYIAFNIYDFMVKKFFDEIVEIISRTNSKLIVVIPDFAHKDINNKFYSKLYDIKEAVGDAFVGVIDDQYLSDSDIYTDIGINHYISAGANLYNARSFEKIMMNSNGGYLSYELNEDDIINILSTVSNKNSSTIFVHQDGLIPWMQSHFCPIGAHQNGCRSCYDNVSYTLKNDNQTECKIISRPLDCSSVIYGQAKNLISDDTINRINELGYNTITVKVVL